MNKIFLILCSIYSFHAIAQTDSIKAVAEIIAFQEELDDFYKDPKESPLEPNALKEFKGHPFFPINLIYRIKAKLTVTPGTPVLHLKTSTTRVTNDHIYGYVEFTLKGKEFRLPVYQSVEPVKKAKDANHLFFPFTDLTNGAQTYTGGRYIDLDIPKKGNDMVIDFNKAYNPYCAYSHRYSCPKVPAENQMDIDIQAGVKYPKVKVQPNEIIKYFDKDWKAVGTRDSASFYRMVEETDNAYIVRDYYISGKIQMISECSSFNPDLAFEGKRTLYFEDGTIQEEGLFVHNEKTGLHNSYYLNGDHKSEIFYVENKGFYRHYWSEEGNDLLQNGNGFISEQSKIYTIVKEIKDSVLFGSFTVEGSDTVYFFAEKPAEYKGGMQALHKDLSAAIRYPKSARRKHLEGRVFVEFIVSKNGMVTHPKVLKGFDPECDQAAIDVVLTVNNWISATHHNRPVQSRFVLPIRFKS